MDTASEIPSDGAFVRAVQLGKVKGPQQRGFKLEHWEKAFKECAGGKRDSVLFVSGIWFHTHFLEVRTATEECSRAACLTSPLSTMVITAIATREWLVTGNKLASIIGDRKRFMLEDLEQTELKTRVGNPISFSNAIDIIVDGVRFPLAMVADAPVSSRMTMSDEQWDAHVGLFGYGSYYHVLESYWMNCVWNGYGVEILDNEIRIRPFDEEFHRQLTVSMYRRSARYNEQTMVGASIYKKLIDSGMEIEPLGKKPMLSMFIKGGVFRVKPDVAARFPESRRAAPSKRMFVHDEHLRTLASKCFRCLAGLSIDRITDAFELLEGLPEQFEKFAPRETDLLSWAEGAPLVPKIRRSELAAAIRSALKLTNDQTEFILNYAIWKPDARRELWFSPLVRIDDEFVSFVSLALMGVNTIRLCDQIISNFPDVKLEADRAFEEFLRKELGKCFKKSKLAQISHILPHAFKPKDPAVGDIDVIFRIGGTVWIGEAKSAANVFSPIEDYRFYRLLHDHAVPQAQRKCAYVSNNLGDIASALGVELKGIHDVRAFVVTSNPVFAGFPIDGVPVVDWNIIELFFSEGSMRHLAYTTDDGRTEHLSRELFYKTIEEAEHRLPEYFNNPPQIAIPRKYVSVDVSEMLPSSFFKGRPARVFNYSVKMPTEEMAGLIQKVAEARGHWASENERLGK